MEKLPLKKLTNIPVIELDEIYLRALRKEDYLDMFEYGSDDQVTRHLTWESYTDSNDVLRNIKSKFLTRPSKGIPSAYAIIHKQDEKMIGMCDFVMIDYEKSSGEIGYVLNRNYWGKGYMTKVCNKVIEFGFSYLELDTIDIAHSVNNIGSKRVIGKCGFRYIDKVFKEKYNICVSRYKMNKEDIIIRKAEKEDSKGKGYVHYTSWIETYTGLFDQSYLDKLSLERRVQLAYNHPENTYLAIIGGKVIGFACYQKSRDEDMINAGEVVAVYILKEYQGRGIGKLLMDVCYEELKEYKRIILWVLEDNKKSVGFYKSQGFELDGKKMSFYEKILVRMVKDNC